jgi:DNA-binding transcriptional ArsR family regulator
LAALAQDNRLDVFRLLVEAGPEGLSAGSVANALELAPDTLTFHFDRLRNAGLVTVRREGRSMIYAAILRACSALSLCVVKANRRRRLGSAEKRRLVR